MARTDIRPLNPHIAAGVTDRSTPRRGVLNYRRQEMLTAYLLILPTLIGFLIFVIGPILASFVLAFTKYDVLTPPAFIGLGNFNAMLLDRRVVPIFTNTILYVVGMVSLDLVVALSLAIAINSHMPRVLKTLFQSVVFFPVLVSAAVMAIVWRALLDSNNGIVNYYLGFLGIGKIPWLLAAQWTIPSVIIVTVWNGVGFNTILLLAGLQAIPEHLYEAAAIDGAGSWAKFWRITVPMLSPVIFFICVKGVIGVLQLFDSPFVLTAGGPGDSSRSILMYIYEQGFESLHMGYASALGLVLFIVILVITIVQFAVSRFWVFSEHS